MTTTDLSALLAELDAGRTIPGGSALHEVMLETSQQALRITADLNGSYHSPGQVRALLGELTGRPVPESTTVFPPLRSDFGRNLRIGERVFINSGCAVQDQGGVSIGDGALLGHNVVIATLNHAMDPARRADLDPAPVHIGADAWIGANVTILPGVSIGDGAVVAAASVVTRDVPPRTLAMGSPARVVREITPEEPGA